MSKPTTNVIAKHLERQGAPANKVHTWARFLTGLDWSTIKPITVIAINTNVHPSFAAGMVARTTRDENVRAVLQAHLESKAAQFNEDGTPEGEPPS